MNARITKSSIPPGVTTFDFLIVGSGIAGLRAAIALAPLGRVLVLTKTVATESNTGYAQGGIAAAIIVFGIYLAIRTWRPGPERPQIAEVQYRKTLVDIESMTRSGEANGEKKPIVLKREPKELTVRLPVGNRSGTYEFQIRDASGKAVVSKQQDASIHDGATEFVVLLNLSELAAGQYSMQVRRVPFDWIYYPVVLR